MKLSALRIDAEKAEQGAWIGDIPDMGDLRLKVRGLRNADFRRLRDRLLSAVPRDKRVNGQIDPETFDGITSRALVDTVLLDWEGLEGDDGQAAPYDKLLATKLLTEPDFRPFRDAVIYAATVVEERAVAAAEDDAGNS